MHAATERTARPNLAAPVLNVPVRTPARLAATCGRSLRFCRSWESC
jgi:hypothetical protein